MLLQNTTLSHSLIQILWHSDELCLTSLNTFRFVWAFGMICILRLDHGNTPSVGGLPKYLPAAL
jgi:hypothetical protein